MSNRTNISRERAQAAFGFAKRGAQADEKYGSYVKRLPMLIRVNGIGNAIAFMYSKYKEDKSGKVKQDGWGELYKHLDEWFYMESQEILKTFFPDREENKTGKPILMEVIATKVDDSGLRLVTMEVLAMSNWLKRFVSSD